MRCFMIHFSKKITIYLISSIFFIFTLNATSSFSGFTGLKINYSANSIDSEYNPDLTLQAFFAGQFNFSDNVWARTEFSLNTGDFISENIFKGTTSLFQIDEVSLNFRGNFEKSINYFSIFLGTFEPIGSDVFLQRYFGIKPIASKITESWLGLSGSILYPQRGFGISDTLKFINKPIAINISAYINQDENKNLVYNTDFRFSSNYRYFTFDALCGIGLPFGNKYQDDNYIFVIEKLYWHAGTNILLGNEYTQSLFIQAGIFNASFTGKNNFNWAKKNIYLLFEPRFNIGNLNFDIALYNIPEENIVELQHVDDVLGINVNIYSENVKIKNNSFTIGVHTNVGLKNKTIFDAKEFSSIKSDDISINLTGYTKAKFLSGELQFMAKIKALEIASGNPGNVFSCGIGYRTKI